MNTKEQLWAPVIRAKDTIPQIMFDVVLALLPCWLAGIIFFGFPAFWIVLLSAVTAALVEALFMRYPWRPKGLIGDGSSLVTGLLVGLILPPTVPWWIPIVGSVLAITIGKLVFGGLGNNIFNPALVGRAILLLAFTAPMVKYVRPFDAVTEATPLLTMRSFDWALVWGNVSGSIGETSVVAILIGAVYLLFRRVIDWRIPVGYVATAFAVAYIWGLDPWVAVTAGGLLFAAVYMATDMVTSPVNPMGRLLFGCGCGVLTILLRKYTSFPEGVTFAILTMNALVPLLDMLTVPVIFGARRSREQRFAATIAVAVVICLAWGVLAVINQTVPEEVPVTAEGVYLPLMETLGTDAYETETINDKVYYFTGTREAPEKVALVGSEQGYHGPIYFYLVLDGSGKIEHIQILTHSDDPGLGSLVTRRSFLDQFIGLDTAELTMDVDIQGITGATISSRAVIRGVTNELERFQDAFYGSGAADAGAGYVDGVYVAEASGFGGPVKVEVSIDNGQIAAVMVLAHGETPGISDEALKVMPQRIAAANSTDVDLVSGATLTSKAIVAAVDKALAQAVPTEATGAAAEPGGMASNVPDGVYRGRGAGFNGDVVVDVTVAGGKITAIEVVEYADTPFYAQAAFAQLIPEIIEQQGLVDTRSGATFSSKGLLQAVEAALSGAAAPVGQGLASDLPDGVYRGKGAGFTGDVVVDVTVAGGKITAIEVVEHADTPFYAQAAFAKLIPEIIEQQGLVDTSSGATFSSKGLLEAVEAALTGKEAQ
ncbi:MAG TPA: RnfABCDGE type electron transport complex subunit D [Firmicutes bacterium]|nr:RnfABCDGE type electron transport complex subunit D [Bacillota bacterium]